LDGVTDKRRIILADDHPIFVAGLYAFIQVEGDLEIVGSAATGIEALKLIHESKPDLAVVDISMPVLTGIGLLRRIAEQRLSVRILMLSLHEDRAHVTQALQAGARGYVLKRSACENFIAAIRAVLAGGIYIDPALAGRMFNSRPARQGSCAFDLDRSELTGREADVLKLAALGFTNKEIARQLDVGVKSIETYKARGSTKLGLKTRVELVRYASMQGWLAGI